MDIPVVGFPMFERYPAVVERVREWIRRKRAWEPVECEYSYKRVVRQASGPVVHIQEEKTLVNEITGEEKIEYADIDTVYPGHRWRFGGPVKWEGKFVYPDKDAVVFGGVARGYQR